MIPELSRYTKSRLRIGTKDFVYERFPLGVARLLAPTLFPGATPFRPEIVAAGAIFIHVPKAAGTTVKTRLYGEGRGGGHRRIVEYAAYDPAMTRDFFKFGFVRNPWDRLLSAHAYLGGGRGVTNRDRRFYREEVKKFGDFESFVLALTNKNTRRRIMSYDHFKSQSYWVKIPGQSGHALDFLGRFECFEEDFQQVLTRLGKSDAPLGRDRPSVHAPYRNAYTDRMRDVVADLYAEDIRMFGYAF